MVIIIYFISGGFYYTKRAKAKAKWNNELKMEFINTQTDEIFKGIFTCEIDKDNKQIYSFQFPDILIGKNRFLNIKFCPEDKDELHVFENIELLKGKTAFLIFENNYYSPTNKSIYEIIFSQAPIKDPSNFFNKSRITEQQDSIFLISILPVLNSIKIELMIWKKQIDGKYTTSSYKDKYFANVETGNCVIKKIQRKPVLNSLKIIFSGTIDLITAPFQLIIRLIYFLIVLRAGGPCK